MGGGGGLGGTLQQFAWPEALQSFLFALQWTILAMFSTNVTIFHHLISQAGWNRCNLSIYLSWFPWFLEYIQLSNYRSNRDDFLLVCVGL